MRIQSLSICPIALSLFLSGSSGLLAQSSLPADISDSYFTQEALDSDELQELIDSYRDNPLIWETCHIADLRSLPLNNHIKNSLIETKRRSAKIADWHSLAKSTGLNSAEIEAVRHFITIAPVRRQSGSFINYIAIRRQSGAANLQKSLQRARFQTDDGWFVGAVLENDHDEPRLGDYGNFSLRSPIFHDRLEFWGGAYRLQWGQEVLFAANLMNGRSAAIDANLRPARGGFKSYLGADENRFLFGGAANLKIKNFSLSAFGSSHRLDATLSDSGTVITLRSDGLHISSSQLQAKDALTESLAGVSLSSNGNNGNLGLLLFRVRYSHALNALEGRSQNAGFSFAHHHEYESWSLSGEFSSLTTGGTALIENFGINLHPFLLSLGWRYFSPDFFAPLGSPFRKFGGQPANESGFYSGLKIKIGKRWWCSGSLDFFRQLESTQTGAEKTNGREALVGINHISGTEGALEAWFKTTRYYQSSDTPTECQIKLHLRKSFTKNFMSEIRTTVRWNNSVRIADGGQAFGIVGRFVLPQRFKIQVGTTHYFVSRSDFSIYFYEPGLPSQFNLNNLSGHGQRYFLIINRPIGVACEIAGALRWRQAGSIIDPENLTDWSFDLQMTIDL